MTPVSLILLAFSHMLDGYGMGIITRNGYPIQKCDCLTGCCNTIETHRRGEHAKPDLEIDCSSHFNLRSGGLPLVYLPGAIEPLR